MHICSRHAGRLTRIGLCLLLGGCAQLGPQAIKGTRLDYNIAVQRTTDEQLLVNLVRMRYRDTPFFLDVSAIAAQLSFSTGASASADLVRGGDDNFGLDGNINFTETPTISYSPL